MLLTGLYVTYYGYYEIRLFFTDGAANDPIIEGAGAIQSWLAHGVDLLGAWPLVGTVAILVVVALLWRVRSRNIPTPGETTTTIDQ